VEVFGTDPLPFWIQKEGEIVWDTVWFGYLYSAAEVGSVLFWKNLFLVSPPTF